MSEGQTLTKGTKQTGTINTKKSGRPSTPAPERFMNLVMKANGNILDKRKCWTFTNDACEGYGLFGNGETVTYAHRFSYELFNGSIPEGMQVSHSCNSRSCVNPRHLMISTPAANTAYMYLCGREKKYADRRPRRPMSDTERFGCVALRALGLSFYAIAKYYDRQPQHIQKVIKRFLVKNTEPLLDVSSKP